MSEQTDAAFTVTLDEFEQLVADEFELLPADMLDQLDNVVFIIEDAPTTDENFDDDERFAHYEGIALTERGQYGFGELPDQIVIYRTTHVAACESLDELRDEIHTTLVHEIGHYFGLDDDRLHDLGWA